MTLTITFTNKKRVRILDTLGYFYELDHIIV